MKPRIAVVGIGRWGRNLIREFSAVADITYCVHAGNPENKKWLAENYPHISAASHEAVLADPAIAAVVIATPIRTHFELATKALEAGKHVFLEKPGCGSETELAQLIALAEKKRLGLQIGYIFLHHPCFAYLAEHMAAPIQSVACLWEKFGSFEEDIVLNLGCHDFALLHALKKQEPAKPTLLYSLPAVSAGDMIGIRADYADGSTAVITINRVSSNKKKSLTITVAGDIWLWQDNQVWRSVGGGKPFELAYESAVTALAKECASFIDMISSKPRILYGDVALSVHRSMAALRGAA